MKLIIQWDIAALQDDIVQFCCADAGAGGMGGKLKP